MVKMKSPEGNVELVTEASVKSLSKAGWTIVPNDEPEGAAAPGGTPPATTQSSLTRHVDEDQTVKPGEHEGIIVAIEPRTNEFKGKEIKYLDLQIEIDDKKIKAGYPDSLSPNSMLGKLLARFGTEVRPGANIDLEAILMGKTVIVQTTNDEKGYTRVDRGTMKLKGN